MNGKKTKALLINPPAGQTQLIKEKKKKDEAYFYPYSLIYLMSYSLKAGYYVDLYDLSIDPYEGLAGIIRDAKPHVIGTTALAVNRFEAMDVLKKIKTDFPETLAVLGGKFFVDRPGFAEEILKSESYIDMVAVGDGEKTFKEILDAVENRSPFGQIKGLVYRDVSGKIIQNEKRKDAAILDELDIDFDLLPDKINARYSTMIKLRHFEEEGLRAHAMLLGRGCTGRCIFCVRSNEPAYHVRSLESSLEEIEGFVKKKNVRYFSFNDPCFTIRPSFVKDFCNAIIERRLNIKWYCEARVDAPTPILELMKKAGCISVDFGVESGSPKILKVIRKAIDPDMVIRFADACNDLGIRAGAFFMISHPDETEEDVELTLELIRKLSRKHIEIILQCTQILPHTVLEKIARERNILPKNFSWLDRGYCHNNRFMKKRNMPPYVEHLSLDYIERALDEAGRIKQLNLSLRDYVWSIINEFKMVKDDFGIRSLLLLPMKLPLTLTRPLRYRLGLTRANIAKHKKMKSI